MWIAPPPLAGGLLKSVASKLTSSVTLALTLGVLILVASFVLKLARVVARNYGDSR